MEGRAKMITKRNNNEYMYRVFFYKLSVRLHVILRVWHFYGGPIKNTTLSNILSHQNPIIFPQSIRELVGNELVYTMTVDGVPDLVCVQKFKRVA